MKTQYVAGLYCRLSKDDERAGESVSIGTQRAILTEFCLQNNYGIFKVYVDDGYSGLNFERPAFQELLRDVEAGLVNMVVTKDLSRLGRDYIMTGYYSEVFFQTKGVRYIALADNEDSLYGVNEIAPFKNILNDMYARDISRKVKNAKMQRAKQGLFIGSQAPYGYQKSNDKPERLIIDSEAAETVRMIFSLSKTGLGSIAISQELKKQQILTPSAYKLRHGDSRFQRYIPEEEGGSFRWCPETVTQILNNRVYLGELTSLKTETLNCKTKLRSNVPTERQIIIPDAHEAIITPELFNRVQEIRNAHKCPAHMKRNNIFRSKLFCECCGHSLFLSTKQLLDHKADLYQCMYHYKNPDGCPKTHRIYHEILYPYVLQQIRQFGKSMKHRKVSSPIRDYSVIEELTSDILDDVIERIEIGHVTKKSKPGAVIQIYWKLK